MLKLKYLFENYDLAKKALENWEHDKDNLDELLTQFRISSNAIYPYSNHGNICFLRLTPTDEILEKNIFGEIEFIEYLNKKGYPALKPIRTKSDDAVIKLDTEWGSYYASSFVRVPGTRLDRTDYNHEIMYQYGKALGRLHSLSSEFVPEVKKWTHSEALEWMKQALTECKAPSFVFSELEAVKEELSQLPMDTLSYGLVHYDFEPDNVFYDENTDTCSVIDFNDGMYHWYALDLEQAFDCLAEEIEGDKLQEAKAQFINGYKSEHPWSLNMEDTLPLMRRFCNLFSYTRILRSTQEYLDNEPDWLIGLRKKLDMRLRELEGGMH